MKKNKYDLIITGGGTAGSAAAIAAAKNGLNVLLLEKNTFLGGTMTGAMVTPMMNNISFKDKKFSDSVLYEILSELYSSNGAILYKDGNPAWFNPEKMKSVLEDKVLKSGAEILYEAVVCGVVKKGNNLESVRVFYKGQYFDFCANYFIDATGDANVAFMSGVDFVSGNENAKNQFMSLRFEMSGIDEKRFAQWMKENKIDDDVSNCYEKNEKETYLSLGFALSERKTPYEAVNDIIAKALNNNDIDADDISYIQFFSVPGKRGSASFNCPRINLNLDPLCISDTTRALTEGRKRIFKLEAFFKKYFPGFKNSYVVSIASELGIRDSRRIDAEYVLTKKDIQNGKLFENPVFESDYPIDVHQENEHIEHSRQKYGAPLECCIPKGIDNLFVAGRCIGADFYAQAALRIQPNCFSMGEYLGRYIANVKK